MASSLHDFQESRATPPSDSNSQHKGNGVLCVHCGCAENSDRFSTLSTANSSCSSSVISVREATTHKPTHQSNNNHHHHHHNFHHNHSPFSGGKRSRSRLVSRRSESCIDLNRNSQRGLSPKSNNNNNRINDNNNDDKSTRRSPSISSLSQNASAGRPFSRSIDGESRSNRTEERIHDPKDCVKDSSLYYLTPLQRKDRESKEMKKEIARLYNELSQKDERIYQLQLQLEEQAKEYQDELDRKVAEIQDLVEEKEHVLETSRQQKISMEEELAKMDRMFTDLKIQHKLQEDQFQERYLDMYKRGQKAARFEREQELEMIAKSKQPKVTVQELTRKLSMTESELAKWQTLRLDETYKSAGQPLTDADVTLAFLKDSFFHFVCDRDDCFRHFRAIAEIFRYSDIQMTRIRKTVSESKDFTRLFKKEVG